MSLINTSLPNLIQGVSQQPESLQYAGQCKLQENALSTVVDGLMKRPPCEHVAQILAEAVDSNAYVKIIKRDDNEAYAVIIEQGKLQIFNLFTGRLCSINNTERFYRTGLFNAETIGFPLTAGHQSLNNIMLDTSLTSSSAITHKDQPANIFDINTAENQHSNLITDGIYVEIPNDFPCESDFNAVATKDATNIGWKFNPTALVNEPVQASDITIGRGFYSADNHTTLNGINTKVQIYGHEEAGEGHGHASTPRSPRTFTLGTRFEFDFNCSFPEDADSWSPIFCSQNDAQGGIHQLAKVDKTTNAYREIVSGQANRHVNTLESSITGSQLRAEIAEFKYQNIGGFSGTDNETNYDMQEFGDYYLNSGCITMERWQNSNGTPTSTAQIVMIPNTSFMCTRKNYGGSSTLKRIGAARTIWYIHDIWDGEFHDVNIKVYDGKITVHVDGVNQVLYGKGDDKTSIASSNLAERWMDQWNTTTLDFSDGNSNVTIFNNNTNNDLNNFRDPSQLSASGQYNYLFGVQFERLSEDNSLYAEVYTDAYEPVQESTDGWEYCREGRISHPYVRRNLRAKFGNTLIKDGSDDAVGTKQMTDYRRIMNGLFGLEKPCYNFRLGASYDMVTFADSDEDKVKFKISGATFRHFKCTTYNAKGEEYPQIDYTFEKNSNTNDNNELRQVDDFSGKNRTGLIRNSANNYSDWSLDDIVTTDITLRGSHYLRISDATKLKENIKALTIADTTLLLNKEKTVKMKDTTSPAMDTRALLFIKQGDFSKKYGVKIGGTSHFIYSQPSLPTGAASTAHQNADTTSQDAANFYGHGTNKTLREISTVSHMADSSNILALLKAKLTADGKTVEQRGNLLIMTGSTTSHEAIDGLSGAGMGVVHRYVNSMTDLPPTAPHRYRVKVRGDVDLNEDDYYVEYLVDGQDANATISTAVTSSTVVGKGSWVEVAGDGVLTSIDETSMPRQLVNTGLNNFTFQTMGLDIRKAGDLDTNPNPSFIGKRINNLFSFKSRLGILTNTDVVMSETNFGSFTTQQNFNFFRTSTRTLLDADRIDVSVASKKVVNLKAAEAFQGSLILFADEQQFALKGGDLLTPKSVAINPVTAFEYESSVEPLALGSYLYFPFNRGNFSGLKEFTTNTNTSVYEAKEITEHVPQYIPSNLKSITGSDTEGYLATSDGTDIYMYKYFFSGNQKAVSSWSKFIISGTIVDIQFIDAVLYAIVIKENQTHILKLNLESRHRDVEGYTTHLDFRRKDTILANQSSVSIRLPFVLSTGDELMAISTSGELLTTSVSDSTLTVTRDEALSTSLDFYYGIKYKMKYTFSDPILTLPTDKTKTPTNYINQKLRSGTVFFKDTASFEVKVTPEFRDTISTEFNATKIGQDNTNTVVLEDGEFRFPIFTKAKNTDITLENSSALPSNFYSAEFESFQYGRSRRISG